MTATTVRSHTRSAVVLTLFLVAILAGGLYWYKHVMHVAGPHQDDAMLWVESGDGHAVIRHKLDRLGVIHQIYHYDAARLVARDQFVPKAGEYLVPARASLSQIMAIIDQGYSYQRRLTVVEGVRSADVITQLAANPFLRDDVAAMPDEGDLLPDTYFYTRGTARQAVVDRMQQARQISLAEAWIDRAPGLPFKTPQDALIMASIIEKEAATTTDRGLVAAVLINRLKRSMRLQSDPTVLYENAPTPDPLPVITKQDLQTRTPWNTYVITGLPATPICNPSLESLNAALHPPQSDFLYFVSDGDGGLRFAKTLDEHNRNVRLYRKHRDRSKAVPKSKPKQDR